MNLPVKHLEDLGLYRKKYVIILFLISGLLMSCSNSPIETVLPVAQQVIEETLFELEETRLRKIPGLQILDCNIEFPDSEDNLFYARNQITVKDKGTTVLTMSSNVPYKLFLNNILVYEQEKIREFYFAEIAYGMCRLQDRVEVALPEGSNNLLVVANNPNIKHLPKIFLKEELPPETRGNITFGDWEFAQNNNLENAKLTTTSFNWIPPKKITQHQIKTPEDRIYDREPYNEWTYSNGIMLSGILTLYNQTGDDKLLNYVQNIADFTLQKKPLLEQEYFELNAHRCANYRMFRKSMLDDAGAPVLPYPGLYQITQNSRYLELASEMANYVLNGQERLADGTFSRPEPFPKSVWSDDLAMSVKLLLEMYKIDPEPRLIDECILQIKNIHKYLWDNELLLHRHGYFSQENEQSPVCWSRANGWFIWTLSDALSVIPPDYPTYSDILKIYQKSIAGLIKYQSENGLWHQVINDPASFEETSGSAMFTIAIARGIQNNWISKEHRKLCIQAWKGIESKIEGNKVIDICQGTGIGFDKEFYLNRLRYPNDPRGLGAIFVCATEIQNL